MHIFIGHFMIFWVCLTMCQRMPPICGWENFRHWIKDQDQASAVVSLHLSVLFIYYLDDPKNKKHPLGHPLNIRQTVEPQKKPMT